MSAKKISISAVLVLATALMLGRPVCGAPAGGVAEGLEVSSIAAASSGRHAVPAAHPRLLGSEQRLQELRARTDRHTSGSRVWHAASQPILIPR